MAGKKKTATKCLDPNGQFQGYRFDEDDIANQMAYLFNGEEGEREAEKILTEANERFGGPFQVEERKKFIEEAVKNKATQVDNKLQSGLMDIFDRLQNKGVACSGEDAEKEAVFQLMKGLGLNVDKDNMQTHYDPGPPQIFMVSWINRPSENLANEASNVNKLAGAYEKALRSGSPENDKFEKSWAEQQTHAKNGGPKMDKEEFLKESKQDFESFKEQATYENSSKLSR